MVLCPALPQAGAASLHPFFPSGISGFPGQIINPDQKKKKEKKKGFLLGRQVEPANGRSGKCQGPSREGGGQGESTDVVTPCHFGGTELVNQLGSS